MRGLANAPRTITSWLVRREPKLDRSLLPAAISQSPASVPLRIGATGLMWSVVSLLPKMPSARPVLISVILGNSRLNPSNSGGSSM
ncbi:hypothetical protein D3C83_23290 [compost metagenome]